MFVPRQIFRTDSLNRKGIIMTDKKIISPSNPAFSYMGRIDFEKPDSPLFIYAGSMVTAKFTGTSVGMMIHPYLIYSCTWIGAVVDGVQYKFDLNKSEVPVYIPIAEGLAEGEHTVTIFKRTAGSHHYFRFCGLMLDSTAEIMPDGHEYDMNIEVYGDSVSAGEVVEAVFYTGHTDPEHYSQYDNSWFSYSLTLARKLNARINCNAQGGISLIDGAGYFNPPDYIGLESAYDKLSYVPEMGITKWDFSRFHPDYVIIALGQNDANPDPKRIYDPEYNEKWKTVYKNMVNSLREKYSDSTRFIIITTVLMHEPVWDETLDNIVNELALDNVRRFKFRRNGAATPGHPRISEQEEMACELAEFIISWEK